MRNAWIIAITVSSQTYDKWSGLSELPDLFVALKHDARCRHCTAVAHRVTRRDVELAGLQIGHRSSDGVATVAVINQQLIRQRASRLRQNNYHKYLLAGTCFSNDRSR